jgi:5-hydroxyisourate hydrolase
LQQGPKAARFSLASRKLQGETMGALTTHVLDTAAGKPGDGIAIELYLIGAERQLLAHAVTNRDGRCDQPLLQGTAFTRGKYELVFHAGAYFARQAREQGQKSAEFPFLDQVVVRFAVADADQNYHVPLLISPFGYTTYRGS